MRSTYRRIKQLCPLNTKVNVVFYIDEEENQEGHILRVPALAIAVYDLVDYDTGEVERFGEGELGFVESGSDGIMSVGDEIERTRNFLGYEIDEELDWKEEIERYKERMKAERS